MGEPNDQPPGPLPGPKPPATYPPLSTSGEGGPGIYDDGQGHLVVVGPTGAISPYNPSSDHYINTPGGLFDTSTGQFLPGSTGSGNYTHTTERLVDPNQIAVEQMRGQNALEIAKANNARQTGADLGNIGGQDTLAKQQQQFNQFKDLSSIASNPRNFMQTFFLHRGFQPPAGSAGYSNLPGGLGGGGGLQLPGFLGGGTTGGGTPPPGGTAQTQGDTTGHPMYDPSQVAAMTPKQAPTTAPGSIWSPGGAQGSFTPGTGYGAGGQSFTGSPTANPNPGQPFFTNAADSQAYSAAHPQDPALLERNDARTQAPLGFAHGGVTPEPIMGVGMHSNPQLFHALRSAPGHKYLIGEKGPEGVVPASYLPKFLQSRHGQEAVGQPSGDLASSDAMFGTNAGGMGTTYGRGGMLTYGDGGMVGVPQGASGGDLMSMWASGGPLGMPSRQIQGAMRTPLSGSLMDGGAVGVNSDITAMARGGLFAYDDGGMLAQEDRPDQTQATQGQMGAGQTTSGYGNYTAGANQTPTLSPNYGSGPAVPQGTGGSMTMDGTTTSGYGNYGAGANATPTISPNYGGSPSLQGSGTFNPNDTGGPTYQPLSGAQQATGNPYANNPTYYGNQSPYDALNQQGAIPPFLQRAIQQGQGNQAYGTNMPQKAYLPPGLPLESQLGYDQMSPSEQQAYQSYASSYGVDPNDLLAQIKQQTAPARAHVRTEFIGQ